MKKLRGALLGCGMIAEYHLRGWIRIPEVEIVALCDRNSVRGRERREQFIPGARVYETLEQMLAAEQLDFLDILTPPELHREHCLAAKGAGLHVLCQKPLCDSFEQALALVNEMAGYPKLFAVHENHRYRPWFASVRKRFCEGFFGSPCYLRIEHATAHEPAEAFKNEVEHGVWLEYGSHLVDMMRSILGEPTQVYARTHRLNPRVRGESLVHAVFSYPNCTAAIGTAWKHSAIAQSSLLLTGDLGEAWYEGSLTRDKAGRLRIVRGVQVVSDEVVVPYREFVESFYVFERQCVDAMLGRGLVEQTAAEYMKTFACTFAAYESARTGKIVEIE